MAELGLRHQFLRTLLSELTETDLDCLVAVGSNGLDLRYHTGTGFDDRDRRQTSVGKENLGHADLLAENCLVHCCTSIFEKAH